jgi:phosphate transport system substrate-binding protein
MRFNGSLGSVILAGLTGLAGLFLAVGAGSAAAAPTLKTGGTGAAVGTIEVLVQEYRLRHPDFTIQVVPGLGTSGGLKALSGGALDLALVGRSLKPQETDAGLVAHELGRTPFVVVTNKSGIGNVSTAELAGLIGSSSPVWPDGAPVRLVLRPVADSDTDLLAGFAPEVKAALAEAQQRGGMIRAITDQESANESERLPGSLGTSSLALLRSEQRKLDVLSIDGVAPSMENFASGAYPHGKKLFVVTQGTPRPEAVEFLQFIASPKGREILVRLGYQVPSPR